VYNIFEQKDAPLQGTHRSVKLEQLTMWVNQLACEQKDAPLQGTHRSVGRDTFWTERCTSTGYTPFRWTASRASWPTGETT